MVGLEAAWLVVVPQHVVALVIWALAAAWGLALAQPQALPATRLLAQAMAAEPLGASLAQAYYVQQHPTAAWAWEAAWMAAAEPLGALAVCELLLRPREKGVRK